MAPPTLPAQFRIVTINVNTDGACCSSKIAPLSTSVAFDCELVGIILIGARKLRPLLLDRDGKK